MYLIFFWIYLKLPSLWSKTAPGSDESVAPSTSP
jgi:hypothetical protein